MTKQQATSCQWIDNFAALPTAADFRQQLCDEPITAVPQGFNHEIASDVCREKWKSVKQQASMKEALRLLCI